MEVNLVSYRLQMPAVKGMQCGREYYTIIVPFSLLPKLFYYNEELVPAELRAQRELNERRVPEIASYILHNDDWVFSSLTATVDGDMEFLPASPELPDVGVLEVDMNANFFINDGQHRRAGIIEAMQQNPMLKNETISVVIFRYEGVERSNQMFADLNRYAQKPTKSLNVLYDSRDPLSQATGEMLRRIDLFRDYTDKDRVSLAARSPKLFTLASLYEANRYMLRITRRKLREFSKQDGEKIISFWEAVIRHMPLWQAVGRGDMKPWELREDHVCSHSVVIQALGIMGSYLVNQEQWEALKNLEEIDWRRINREWKGIIIAGSGRVVNSKPVAQLTSIFLRKKLGLAISAAEEKQLEQVRE